jgi:hypothetical protein
MTRDIHPRWWRCAAAFVLLLAVALLVVPQVQQGHASLLFFALAPVLWMFSVVVTELHNVSVDEQIFALDPLLQLPSLSHLPPPGTLA